MISRFKGIDIQDSDVEKVSHVVSSRTQGWRDCSNTTMVYAMLMDPHQDIFEMQKGFIAIAWACAREKRTRKSCIFTEVNLHAFMGIH